jgi:hypothetical protein
LTWEKRVAYEEAREFQLWIGLEQRAEVTRGTCLRSGDVCKGANEVEANAGGLLPARLIFGEFSGVLGGAHWAVM